MIIRCTNCKYENLIGDSWPYDNCDFFNNWQPKDPSTFWMVYGEGKGVPTRKHETREEAVNEAQRLAKLNVGTKFYVLFAQMQVTADEPVVKVEALGTQVHEEDYGTFVLRRSK